MGESKTAGRPQSLSTRFREHPLLALREEIDDVMSRFLGHSGDSWFAGPLSPSVDVSETDTAIQVTMDLPGVKSKEIDIHLSGNTLNVRGERKEQKEEKGKTFHRVERRSGQFSRSVTLPCAVTEDEVAAEYKNGVLMVTLPKSEEAKSRKIQVNNK